MQPNGYRFITGGADSFVRVWNLLPVISSKYEDAGESDSESDEEINQNRVSAENGGKDPSVGSKVPSKKSASVGGLEDSKMNDAEGSDSDEGLTPEEKLKKEQIEKEFDRDIKLMEGLFQDEDTKSKRLLAQLEGHSAPINCVRWNSLGTIFASADDEGTINLWQYRGKKVLSAFQAQMFGMSNSKDGASFEDAKAAFSEAAEAKKKKKSEMEDWGVLKRCRGHRGTISDVAWSPNNINFASCSTDSTICIWDINEHCKFDLTVT